MTQKLRLSGILPAIPTPVRADDTIDTAATRQLIGYLLERGIDGLVPLGGTGEYGSLSREERLKMLQVCVETVGGRVPVIPGVLDPGFADALSAGKAFAAAGADALMVLTPYYTNPTPAGVRDYFLRYADESPVPILLYDIPYRTRVTMAPELLHELSRHENIVGMKCCNTDMYHFAQTAAGIDASFTLLSGEDSLFPFHLAGGAKGGIIVTSCLLPTVWKEIFELASSGRVAEALMAHRRLIPLMNLAFAETNPGPMKSVMDMIGVDAPKMLAPLVQPAPALVAKLRAELAPLLAAAPAHAAT
jgi:4-hydroxy-tetrahydrodipicolinate synthase